MSSSVAFSRLLSASVRTVLLGFFLIGPGCASGALVVPGSGQAPADDDDDDDDDATGDDDDDATGDDDDATGDDDDATGGEGRLSGAMTLVYEWEFEGEPGTCSVSWEIEGVLADVSCEGCDAAFESSAYPAEEDCGDPDFRGWETFYAIYGQPDGTVVIAYLGDGGWNPIGLAERREGALVWANEPYYDPAVGALLSWSGTFIIR